MRARRMSCCLAIGFGSAAACSGEAGVGPVLSEPFTQLATGALHACALTASGFAYCWGWGEHGQLGNGQTEDRAAPVAVAGGLAFVAISAGGAHTCALTAGGRLYCWGFNQSGQLGTGSGTSVAVPVEIAPGTAFSRVSAGGTYTCGLRSDGSALCWGFNQRGQLGDGSTVDRSTPTEVLGGLAFTAIAAGSFHTCGVTAAGAAYCWGQNSSGQLGDSSLLDAAQPVAVKGGITFDDISVGAAHTCGRAAGGTIYCWGSGDFGQLGDPNAGGNALGPRPVPGNTDYALVSAGGSYTCGVRLGGEAWCWGFNQSGQLGGFTDDQCLDPSDPDGLRRFACTPFPIRAADPLLFGTLRASQQFTCGLTVDDVAYCWGLGNRGQLGNGKRGDSYFSFEPVRVERQP